jgi:small ligand-binding sensory domain FIST
LKAAAALSRHPIAATATGEVAGALLEAVGPGADQLFLVASRHHTGTLEDVVAAIRSILGPEALTTERSDIVICGAQVVDDGPALAALAVTGSAPPQALAAPGCRPIGRPLVVTAAEGDLVADLASEPALAVLQRTVDGLDPAERALAAGGLHLGVVLDEHRDRLGPGDFAVRSIRGSVGASALALDAEVQVGATVQFLVADPGTARAELRRAVAGRAATAAVLRVSPDRPAPRRDAALLADLVGPAVAGIAAPGEPAGASVLLFGASG